MFIYFQKSFFGTNNILMTMIYCYNATIQKDPEQLGPENYSTELAISTRPPMSAVQLPRPIPVPTRSACVRNKFIRLFRPCVTDT